MPQQQRSTGVRLKERTDSPRRYRVYMHNDDVTTMDFVVEVLIYIFEHKPEEAVRLMLTIHNNGKAMVGIYTRDEAKEKAVKTITLARQQGFPLKVTCVQE